MKKRILSWLLAFCMVFSMLPATAFATGEDQTVETESETLPTEPTEVDTAATVSTLRVGGVDALAQNAGDGWYFDPATDTLHLTGAYYDGDAEDAIYAEGDLTIDVAEGTENTFHGVNNGILVLGNLTITGSGMLTATASAAYGNGGYYGPVGIYVSENLRITGAKVAADADMVGIGSIGTMEIVDSTVEALGARNGLYSFDDLRISGSNVEAHATSMQADNKWDFRGYFLQGIIVREGDLLIEDGSSVNVSADQFGLYAENTTIQDSDLCATATRAAICTAQKLTINGESNVELHATLTEEQHEEYGDQATALFGVEVEIDENLTIVGGVIGDSLVQGGAKSIVDSEGKDVAKVSIVPSGISGNCGVNLTWTLDAEGILTISGEGTMYDYGRVNAPWYEYREQILSAVVEDGATSIGDYAFIDCSKLTSITIPASVTSIGHAAFHSCSSLTSIAIPAGVTSIRDYTFYGCSSLPSIALPAGVTSIGEYALAKCSSLISIPIPAGVTSIGEYAFHGCSSLTSIAIPAGVTSIAAGMFSSCSSLASVDLPAGVTAIGGSAFYNCNSLTSIDLPAGVTTIGDYAFSNSNKLKSIEIPAGVTSISHSTFHGCSGLASVDLPAGVTSIGVSAFSYCINLTSIDLPAGVTTIGDYAFRSCRGLESIDIPRGVTSIGDSAFAYCEDLVTVTFKGDAPSIHTLAFEDVTANAYYPDGNATWTEEVKQNYSGSLTWIAAIFASFEDVVPGAYYEIPVQWAVENGITSGVDENHFAPNAACTRAQVVTFLWRAAGSPEPASMNNPFVDVAADSFYYKAVLWAVENGITSGNDATHFAPNASCNRAQVVTFLWRFRGRPASGGNNIFTDVEAGSYYYDAVLWAVEKGITSGMGDGTFGTNAACNRGQIVTFLYRTLA